MTTVQENYCLNCDWSASSEDYDPQELSKLAIEHYVETGHDIDSIPTTPSIYKESSTADST